MLVSVFLAGGIDSLSVLFPAGDPAYYSLRPTLALAQSAGRAYTEDSRLRWHPAAGGLATLHDEGKVSVLPAIGYANSDKSHFTSRHYWEVGATDANLRTGWMGRYLDATGTLDNPLQGLTLDVALQPALATAKVPVATLQAADQYTFAPPGLPAHPLEASIFQEAANIGAAHAKSTDAGLQQAGQIALESHGLYQQLGQLRYGFKSPVAYPTSADPFPHRLAGLAAMIAAGLPLRVVSITSPGHFDTHATQAGRAHERAPAHLRLAARLPARPRDARHRRPRARARVVGVRPPRRRERLAGTDHGSAGIGFLIGTQVNGRQIGAFPGVTGGGLDSQGNLVPTADFRAVYAALLEQWLETDANQIIPGAAAFQRPALLK